MDIGDVINGWRIVEDVGAGRSGHVFIVCREGDPDRLFALKMQRTDRPDVAPDANAREAALLRAGMKKSPRVMPALVEVGEWRGVPFFVMERIEEIDFPVPARRYRKFCVEAFTALAELHSWLVHCDIAPCHLGRKGGGIAFIDFDASLPHVEAARGGRCVGTDPYIAPEVASAGRLSEQSDMYSLAMVLLEHCPKRQRDCFDPVLRECLRPAPADRPRSMVQGGFSRNKYFGAKLAEDLVVFDCPKLGNALYILHKDWEFISQHSRRELLSGKLGGDFERVVHTPGWQSRAKRIITTFQE